MPPLWTFEVDLFEEVTLFDGVADVAAAAPTPVSPSRDEAAAATVTNFHDLACTEIPLLHAEERSRYFASRTMALSLALPNACSGSESPSG